MPQDKQEIKPILVVNGITWYSKYGVRAIPHLGYIPLWLSNRSAKSLTEQLNAGYNHGGDWQKTIVQFDVSWDPTAPGKTTLSYFGDPPMHVVAWAQVNDEYVLMFEHAWVMVVKADQTHEICRMD